MQRIKQRFDIQDLWPIGLTLVVLGIGLTYGLTIQEDVREDFEAEDCAANGNFYNTTSQACQANSSSTTAAPVTTESFNATGDAITAVGKIPEKLPLIVTVIVAAVIIGILVRYLMVRF